MDGPENEQKTHGAVNATASFFEEPVERATGIAGRAGSGCGGGWVRSLVRLRYGITSHRDARRKERTLIRRIFRCDAHGNRLQALKTRGRFKVGALLAAVQPGATL